MGVESAGRWVPALSWGVIIVAVAGLVWMNMQRRVVGDLFPHRPLTIICPFSAGGGTDLIARRLAYEAESGAGVPILVSNITGGGGAIGHAAGRMAPADGHTILMATFEMVSLPIQGLVPFTYEDFDLLMLLNMDPAAVTVRADFPADSMEEFIERAKGGDAPSIGNSGTGAVWHLAAALLAERAGMPVIHVPFDGASQAITSLLGGHIDAVTVSPAEVRSYIASGQLKMLAVMSEERLDSAPDVPTCREIGVDVVFGTWRGLALPSEVPAERRSFLYDLFLGAASSDTFRQFAQQSGVNLYTADSHGFHALAARQSQEVSVIMKQLGLVP